MQAGYSKTPLIKKLGIKPSYRVCFLHAPDHYAGLLGDLPEDVQLEDQLLAPLDFIHYFALEEGKLAIDFPALKEALKKTGMVWISWPKKSSKIETDLSFDKVQRIGLFNGLVDTKICAVDQDWSGLKFMYRKSDR